MIVDACIAAVFAGLGAILSLLPTFAMPTPENYHGVLFGLVSVDYVFPALTLLSCMVLVLTVEALLRTWDLAVWIYHQVWGSD